MGVFNKRIIPLALFGYEMIIANSKHSLPIYIYIYIYIYRKTVFRVGYNHLISKKREWNNSFIKNAHKISLNLR